MYCLRLAVYGTSIETFWYTFVYSISHTAILLGKTQICVHDYKDSPVYIRGLLEKYPTFGREKETGLPGALDN